MRPFPLWALPLLAGATRPSCRMTSPKLRPLVPSMPPCRPAATWILRGGGRSQSCVLPHSGVPLRPHAEGDRPLGSVLGLRVAQIKATGGPSRQSLKRSLARASLDTEESPLLSWKDFCLPTCSRPRGELRGPGLEVRGKKEGKEVAPTRCPQGQFARVTGEHVTDWLPRSGSGTVMSLGSGIRSSGTAVVLTAITMRWFMSPERSHCARQRLPTSSQRILRD